MEEDAQILAHEYGKFIKVDATNNVKLLEDDINETLANLEEYGRIVNLMKSDSSVNSEAILTKKGELLTLFEKVRKLEIVVGVVKKNVDEIENLVLNAETDLKITTEGKLRSFFKNVVFKKKTVSTPNSAVNVKPEQTFVPPNIFSTSELFSRNVEP